MDEELDEDICEDKIWDHLIYCGMYNEDDRYSEGVDVLGLHLVDFEAKKEKIEEAEYNVAEAYDEYEPLRVRLQDCRDEYLIDN